MSKPCARPRIACSSRISSDAATLLSFAHRHDLDGIEYSITSESPDQLALEASTIARLGKSDIEIRYHAPFQKVELGHGDDAVAKASAEFMKQCIDIVNDAGGKFIIAHLGLGFRFSLHTLDIDNARKYLFDVSNYSRKKGITICLENLTYGWTNDPGEMLKIVEDTGVSVTIDIGHVAASPLVETNTISPREFIKVLSNHIISSHIYKIEIFDTEKKAPVHIAPQNTSDIKKPVCELLRTKCEWFLIELGEEADVILTKHFLDEIFTAN